FRALIWCPASNYFLLRRTAPVDRLKKATTLLFGTDSTLTAPWDAWSQIRMARDERKLTDEELLDALTVSAARVWGLTGTGELAEGKTADLVIARPGDGFFSIGPGDLLLVIHKGHIRLYDASLEEAFNAQNLVRQGFHKILLDGREKYVQGDLP